MHIRGHWRDSKDLDLINIRREATKQDKHAIVFTNSANKRISQLQKSDLKEKLDSEVLRGIFFVLLSFRKDFYKGVVHHHWIGRSLRLLLWSPVLQMWSVL